MVTLTHFNDDHKIPELRRFCGAVLRSSTLREAQPCMHASAKLRQYAALLAEQVVNSCCTHHATPLTDLFGVDPLDLVPRRVGLVKRSGARPLRGLAILIPHWMSSLDDDHVLRSSTLREAQPCMHAMPRAARHCMHASAKLRRAAPQF